MTTLRPLTEPEFRQLYTLIRHENGAAIREYIQPDMDLNTRDEQGNTLLYHAAASTQKAKDPGPRYCVTSVKRWLTTEPLEVLIGRAREIYDDPAYDAFINGLSGKREMTALAATAEGNKAEAWTILINAGADPRIPTNEGETPEMLAEKSGAQEVLALIRTQPADPSRPVVVREDQTGQPAGTEGAGG